MKKFLVFLVLILVSIPGYSRQGIRLTPAQLKYVGPIRDLILQPEVREYGSVYYVLDHLSDLGDPGDETHGKTRLESHPEEALALIETLEAEEISPEQVNLRHLHVDDFLALLSEAEDAPKSRFETLDVAVGDILRRQGEDGLVHPRVYALKEKWVRLNADRAFLNKIKRETLEILGRQIASGEAALEEKVRDFNETLEKRIAKEIPGAVDDDWFYKDPNNGAWHTLNLGPAVAFETPEAALRDQIERLEEAPPGPWFTPIIDSVQKSLEGGRVPLPGPKLLEIQERLREIRLKIHAADDERFERLSPSVNRANMFFNKKRGRSLEDLGLILKEVEGLIRPVGEDGKEIELDPGIRMRIDQALKRGRFFHFFPSWGKISEMTRQVEEYWEPERDTHMNLLIASVFIFIFPFLLSFLDGPPGSHGLWLLLLPTSFYFVWFASSVGPRLDTVNKIKDLYESIKEHFVDEVSEK